MKTSDMLEIILPRLNQTYAREHIETELEYTEDILKVACLFPIGTFIRISNARYNNGIFEIIDNIKGGHIKLDRALHAGKETAVITPLNIPRGLLEIIKGMCEEVNNNLAAIKRGDTSISYDPELLYKRYSKLLGTYKRLKTI